jgi:Protein of unknown function (DUF4236)
MGGKRKSNEDLIVLAVVALLVWIASRVKGSFRSIVTLVLVAGAILEFSTAKAGIAGLLVVGVALMWREKLPRGLYLRRALSIGRFRVNVSTSGLGGSVGVKGARIGRRPDGSTYVHAGRGGLYYRKELLRNDSRQPEKEVRAPTLPANDPWKGIARSGLPSGDSAPVPLNEAASQVAISMPEEATRAEIVRLMESLKASFDSHPGGKHKR